MARIASLHVYPVKACRGIDLDAMTLTETGPAWDRRWMIVRPTGQFLTQREFPRFATIDVAVEGARLRLSAEGRAPVEVAADHDGPRLDVRIWRDRCRGIDAGEEAAAWLTDYLGEPLRLVRIDPGVTRHADAKWAGPGQPVAFADGYPLLLISRESLALLNERLPAPIPMARFRPNVVIEGVAPHAEDAMTGFRSGKVVLRGVKLCARCAVTTTDQRTGAVDPRQQPLRTLHTYRHDRKLRGVVFGQNCIIVEGVGEVLRVGAEFTIDAA